MILSQKSRILLNIDVLIYTVNHCGGKIFERLAMSFYITYRDSKDRFRILRHSSFTDRRPKSVPQKVQISPTLVLALAFYPLPF